VDYAICFSRYNHDANGTTYQPAQFSIFAEHQEWRTVQPAQVPRPLKIFTNSCNELGNKSAVALANALGCKHVLQINKSIGSGWEQSPIGSTQGWRICALFATVQ
jgi:hypothetical protein